MENDPGTLDRILDRIENTISSFVENNIYKNKKFNLDFIHLLLMLGVMAAYFFVLLKTDVIKKLLNPWGEGWIWVLAALIAGVFLLAIGIINRCFIYQEKFQWVGFVFIIIIAIAHIVASYIWMGSGAGIIPIFLLIAPTIIAFRVAIPKY